MGITKICLRYRFGLNLCSGYYLLSRMVAFMYFCIFINARIIYHKTYVYERNKHRTFTKHS